MPALEDLTIDHFSDRIGQTFRATAEGRTLPLTPRSVDALPRPVEDQGREPFSLEFHHEGVEDHVPQQIVAIEHDDLGSFDLFVVPLGPAGGGMRYEAIFT